MKNYIVAVDGFSSTGKSTIAKKIAEYFKWTHIDSGAMYRAITLYAIHNFFDPIKKQINFLKLISNLHFIDIDFRFNKKNHINELYLNKQNVATEIRSFLVSQLVSKIAKINFIREFLTKKQKKMAYNKSIIMDGRDIGTVIFPNADFKFFIIASLEKRTERRFLEFLSKKITKEEIKKNLISRDLDDSQRKISPLVIADDAIVIDNSNLDQKETIKFIINCINKKLYKL